MGRDLLMGVWRLIAAGKSRTILTNFVHDFRSDLLIQNELGLKCTPFRAAKNFSFPALTKAAIQRTCKSAS
jgi:hypothetical protein